MTRRAVVLARLRRGFAEESSFDLRALALFRAVAGLALIAYLLGRMRGDSLVAFHTDLGVLPSAAMRESSRSSGVWSLLFHVTTPDGVRALTAGMLVVFAAFALGFATRLTALLTWLALLTLHHRNPLVTTAAAVFMNVAAVWVATLPLGEVWSFDAWCRSRGGAMRPRRSRVVTLAALGLRLHVFYIYFLNVVQKDGISWRTGQAVHRMIWSSWTGTPLAHALRHHEPAWLSPLLSYATLAIELAIALLVISPIRGRSARRVAAGSIVLLHVGIHLIADLGVFVYALPMLAFLLVATDDWSGVERRVRALAVRVPWLDRLIASTSPTTLATERRDPPALVLAGLRELFFVGVAAAISWNVWDVNVAPERWFGPTTAPRAANLVVELFDLPGGWHLFAPDVPDRDARVVVDAVLADGRHVDPLTHARPDFDVVHHGPWRWHYLWQAYQYELAFRNQRNLWVPFVDYLRRVPRIERWSGSREVVAVDVYVVSIRRPAYGRPETLGRIALAARWARDEDRAAPGAPPHAGGR